MPDGRHRALLPRHRVARWLTMALPAGPAEITVRVVGADEARHLNQAFRHKDYVPNVLTFDYARGPIVVADIVLCAAVIEHEAVQQRVPLADHYAHLVVHGALHAAGHDHQDARQARAMQALEAAVLSRLGIADPYRRRDAPSQASRSSRAASSAK
jgi:probable rRNA maturation factor